MDKDFDVVIIGAGPAGVACALALRNSSLKVALVDKRKFPRDKTCGDAIPGPTLRYLKEILPEFPEEFEKFEQKHRTRKSTLFMPNGAAVSVNWKTKAYNSTRMSFDDFLFELVKKHSETTVLEEVSMIKASRDNEKVKIHLRGGAELNCLAIVAGDGANSQVYRYLGSEVEQRSPESVAVRAYYKDVDFPTDANGFYLIKNFPGYFWIFPLRENLYNVGIGLLREDMAKDFSLKSYLEEVVADKSIFGDMFVKSELVSKIVGHNLTSATKRISISGERYLLVGDAAHLIDPIQGHGIDKAVKSGALAADQLMKSFDQNDFSSSFMSNYDDAVYSSIGKELLRNFRFMNLYRRFPWFFTMIQPLAKLNMDFVMKLFYGWSGSRKGSR